MGKGKRMARFHHTALRLLCAAALGLAQIVPVTVLPDTANADSDQNISLLRIASAADLPAVRAVNLGLNKSMIVELPVGVRDVMVSNPNKIDAVMQTSRRAYVVGKDVGEANVFFTDAQGHQVLTLEISIQRDLSALAGLLHRLIPDSDIHVESFGGNIVLTGTVKTPADANRAEEVTDGVLTYDPDQPLSTLSTSGGSTTSGAAQTDSQTNSTGQRKIINMITVEGREQVLLKVSVVEMERNVVKQLGVDLNAVINSGNFSFAALSALPFPVTGGTAIGTAGGSVGWTSGSNHVTGALQALEQNGLIHTLAEPNLTAISGETANFLAGGEFPIVTGVDPTTNVPSITFKNYGVSLAFTPVVMTEGRISLKISTEVSELSNDGAVALADGITVPGLKTRKAETTVELPSGGSLVIAGLLSDQSRQALSGYPGLKNLPVLGTLFRSRDFQKDETELVVICTPYIAKAVARNQLTQPDQGFGWASDANADLLGQMNRVYGRKPERKPVGKFDGDIGYIVE
jgi:pilus assembly protein CpaC